MTLTLWRCSECGKWSHAKRRPNTHERFIGDGSDPGHPTWTAENIAADLELPTLRTEEGWYGEFDARPGGSWVACGPFEEWRAERAA